MQNRYVQAPRYHALMAGGLTLFSLSLALSKSASNITIVLLYLAAFFYIARYRDARSALFKSVRQPLLPPLALYLFSAILGLLFTANLHDGVGIVNKLVGLLLVYYMVSVLLDSLGAREKESGVAERLLLAFLAGIFALDLIAVPSYLGVIGDGKIARSFAPLLTLHHIWFANLNSIGTYAAAGLLLFPLRRYGVRKKAFLISFLALNGISVLLSASRSAWLSMFLVTIVLAYLCIKDRKIFFILIALTVGAAFLLYHFNGIVHMRVSRAIGEIPLFLAGQAQTDVGERFLMWKGALKMFLSNPIFGVGTGDYVFTMNNYMATGELPAYLAQFNQPHNMYLFALATNGLVGLAALLYIFYRGLHYALPLLKSGGSERLFAFLAAATIIHYMAAGMTDSFFNIQILRYVFGFMMGVCVRASLGVSKTET